MVLCRGVGATDIDGPAVRAAHRGRHFSQLPDRSNSAIVATMCPAKSIGTTTVPSFAALRAFDAVVRHGGFRKGAQSLQCDHATVSRYVRVVEDWVGAVLIKRTAVGVTLTEDGLRCHRQIAQALKRISDAKRKLLSSIHPDGGITPMRAPRAAARLDTRSGSGCPRRRA